MADFGQHFIASRGALIDYLGRTLLLLDKMPARLGEKFRVTIETTLSPYPQGVGVSEGVEVFGSRVSRAVVWEYFSLPPERREAERSQLPFSFEVTCRNKQGSLSFYNMAEYRGRQEWWSGGSCMYVEEINKGRRYFCNDFDLDDDFNDIVFTVVKVG